MEMQIKAGGFSRTITVNAKQEGLRFAGRRRIGLEVVEEGTEVPVFRAYCDQLSLIYTEGDTESIALERMRLAAIAAYDSLV